MDESDEDEAIIEDKNERMELLKGHKSLSFDMLTKLTKNTNIKKRHLTDRLNKMEADNRIIYREYDV